MNNDMKRLLTALVLIMLAVHGLWAQERVIILTDVENEPDDNESLVRLMLYTNEIDVRGIVATNSTHMRDRIAPETIFQVIDAYEQVRPNLLLHAKGYPEASYLRSVVKRGTTAYGMTGVGKGQESEGSRWIIQELEREDERPLWICAWGGVNVLAQALYDLKATKSAQELERLLAKLRVYTISDQDDTGIWIRRNFPTLFYIVSPGGYGNGTWTGIMEVTAGADNKRISNAWLAEHIQQDHGPLGACYPDVAYGMEGDTPSWLNLIPNGLNAPEHPNWGGWGGRYELYKPRREDCDPNGFTGGVPIEEEPRAIWTNAIDHYRPFLPKSHGCAVVRDTAEYVGYTTTVWRWRTHLQNDFAARMDWCVKPYEKANHAPEPRLAHANEFTVKSGEVFVLDATPSTDPDGDNLSYLWYCYPEAGSGRLVEPMGAPNIHRVSVRAPEVSKPEDIHFILQLTDKGHPSLTRYQRIVVHVE